MKKLLTIFILSCMLLSEVAFGYTLSDKEINTAKQRVEFLNSKIRKGTAYDIVYKQQLLIQNNTKKRRDRLKPNSPIYRVLDKNFSISQYILENLIDSKGYTKIVQQSSQPQLGQSSVSLQNCEPDWHFDEGSKNCQPNNITRSCTIQNGNGIQNWNGNTWWSCIVSSCKVWYTLSNETCTLSQPIQQNPNLNCLSDQHIENNLCTFNVKSCSIVNGNGQQSWSNHGYWNCRVVTCNLGYQKNQDSTNCSPMILASQYPWCDTPDITLWDKIWAACNVWSSIAGFWSESYGSYFQWGRNDTWFTLTTENSPYDWQQPSNGDSWWDTTDTLIARQWPCSIGYHVPTQTEWMRAIEYSNGQYNTLRNTLKLASSGWHASDNSEYYGQGTGGFYWSSSPVLNLPKSYYMNIYTWNWSVTGDFKSSGFRAVWYSVRCVKN